MTHDKNAGSSQGDSAGDKKSGKRVIGEGMTSLDSTQAPLKSETGEPDWDAMTGGKPSGDKNKDRPSSQR